jgi:hypothetical protein
MVYEIHYSSTRLEGLRKNFSTDIPADNEIGYDSSQILPLLLSYDLSFQFVASNFYCS